MKVSVSKAKFALGSFVAFFFFYSVLIFRCLHLCWCTVFANCLRAGIEICREQMAKHRRETFLRLCSIRRSMTKRQNKCRARRRASEEEKYDAKNDFSCRERFVYVPAVLRTPAQAHCIMTTALPHHPLIFPRITID